MKVVRHFLPPSELVAFAKFIHNINTFYTLCGSDQCSCRMCRCPNHHISLHIELYEHLESGSPYLGINLSARLMSVIIRQ